MESSDETIKIFLNELREGSDELAHAIRSPLSIILGIVEDIESGNQLNQEDISDARDAIDRVRAQLQRATLGNVLRLETKAGLETELRNTFPNYSIFSSLKQEVYQQLPTAYLLSIISLLVEEFEPNKKASLGATGFNLIVASDCSQKTAIASCKKFYLIASHSPLTDFNENLVRDYPQYNFSNLTKTKIAILNFLLKQSATKIIRLQNDDYGIVVKLGS